MRKFIGFDLEIAAEIPKGEPIESYRPLGITCASAVANDLILHWEAKQDDKFLPCMTEVQCREMVLDLKNLVKNGYEIVTWNGLQFDFDVLQEESGVDLIDLALDHLDPMFQFFCMTGYPVGLDTVAKTMGLQGKLDGMKGDLAPAMWKINPQLVIDYVIQDGRTTLDVADRIEQLHRLAWVTHSEKFRIQPFPVGLLSVRECLEFPLPDQSWMTNPRSRESYLAWMKIKNDHQN